MRNLLITGASNGIGKAFYDIIDKDLFNKIILVDVNQNEQLTNSEKIQFYKCDISISAQVNNLFNELDDQKILISDAVNCAGVPGPNKPFNQSSIEEFDRIININLRGLFLMLRGELNHMEKLNFGKIINIASVLASCGMKGSSYYSASKAGIVGMTKSLAIEYAEKNIQINCISPGGVDTNLIDSLKNRVGLKALENIHPVKRIAQPLEIAIYLKFMIENNTSFMTGSEIFIDGGYSAQ
jgi:3-oxoacyl-[acyl-carrier protein] reductase